MIPKSTGTYRAAPASACAEEVSAFPSARWEAKDEPEAFAPPPTGKPIPIALDLESGWTIVGEFRTRAALPEGERVVTVRFCDSDDGASSVRAIRTGDHVAAQIAGLRRKLDLGALQDRIRALISSDRIVDEIMAIARTHYSPLGDAA